MNIAILLLLLSSTALYAQKNSSRKWEKQNWEKAKQGIEYHQKDKKEDQQQQSQIDLEDAFDFSEAWYQTGLGKLILVVLLISIFAFIIHRLMIANHDARLKANIENQFSLEYIEENLDKSDIDKYLNLALEGSEYRIATRLLFLKSIKNLNRLGLITWRKDKTNNDFLNEMRSHQHYRIFRDLTLAYEIVWYGEHDVKPSEFEHIQEGFQKFEASINKTIDNEK